MSILEIIFGITTLLGFIVALPQLWGRNWKNIAQYYSKGIISWENVHKASLNIVFKIKERGFKPNLIIGVGRGGILAAGLLCSELTQKELIKDTVKGKSHLQTKIRICVIDSKVFFKNTDTLNKNHNQLQTSIDRIEQSEIDFNIDPQDKILVVVSQNFKGETLLNTINKLLEKGVSRDNILSVALFWHKHKYIEIIHEPDLFGYVLSIEKTMPWKDYQINTDRY